MGNSLVNHPASIWGLTTTEQILVALLVVVCLACVVLWRGWQRERRISWTEKPFSVPYRAFSPRLAVDQNAAEPRGAVQCAAIECAATECVADPSVANPLRQENADRRDAATDMELGGVLAREGARENAQRSTVERALAEYSLAENSLAEIAKHLQESQERLAYARRIAGLGTWLWEPESEKVSWSQECYERFGLDPKEFVPTVTSYLALLHPDDLPHVKQCIAAVLAGSDQFNYDARVRKSDGSIVWIHVVAKVQRDAQGQLLRLEGIDQDITQRKHIEHELRQAQKMEAVGRLAGGIAHDFNNLLTVIKGYCELLLNFQEDRKMPPSDWQASVEEIRDAGDRAARLTQQLLAFSRRAIVQPRSLDVNNSILEAQSLIERLIGKQITLKLLLSPDIAPVYADSAQIEQLLINLIVNARDAMPEGGQLSVSTEQVVMGESTDHLGRQVRPGNYILLTVRDSGLGISEDLQARIFEPFVSTKNSVSGSGLGLSVVHGIAAECGGYVGFETSASGGSTFRVLLPVCDPATAPLLDEHSRIVRRDLTILVVEDDDAVRNIISNLLKAQGYSVLLASSGAEAMALAQRTSKGIDLLLTDVVMPGMSGRELAELLRSSWPNMRILFMSGYTDDTVFRHGIVKRDAFVAKPFTIDALRSKVQDALTRA